MIDKYTAQAKTQEEAIEKGLKELNISRSEAEIEINSPGKKGFLGFGAKDAVVTVKRKGKPKIEKVVDEAMAESTFLNEESEDTRSQEEVVDQEPSQSSEKTESVETQTTNETEVTETDTSKLVEEKEEALDQEEREDKKPETENNQEDIEAIDYVRDYLDRVITHMGIDDAKVSVSRDDRYIQYDIETEDAGLVIGRHGKVLNGLQTLAQIQLHQRADNKLHASVDAENYRNRRKDTVEHLAKKTARQVQNTNQAVILEPMPAHERKQIHRYLSRYDDLQTHSEGKEPHRYLVVEPKI